MESDQRPGMNSKVAYYKECVARDNSRVQYGNSQVINHYAAPPSASRHPEDKSYERDLLVAAEHGQLDLLKRLLRTDVDINYSSTDGRTALHRAVQNGQEEVVACLIRAGCKLDMTCQGLGTPLIEAAYRGHTRIVELLLDASADKDKIIPPRGTALHAGCFSGHIRIVELLLQAGACAIKELPVCYPDLEPFDTGKGTAPVQFFCQVRCQPMWLAIYKGHTGVIPILARFGARADISADFQRSREAASDLEGVLGSKGKGFGQIEKRTAIWTAMGHVQDASILKETLKAGANVELRDSSTRTPLEYAVRYEHIELVRVLIEGGASVNSVGSWGHSPLDNAVEFRNLKIAKILIDNGAIIRSPSHYRGLPSGPANIGQGGEIFQFLEDAREWTFL